MNTEQPDYGKIAQEAYKEIEPWKCSTKEFWERIVAPVISAYQAANPPTAARVLTCAEVQEIIMYATGVMCQPAGRLEKIRDYIMSLLTDPPAAQAGDSPELSIFTKELEAKLASMTSEELMAALKRAGCEFEEQAGEVATGGPDADWKEIARKLALALEESNDAHEGKYVMHDEDVDRSNAALKLYVDATKPQPKASEATEQDSAELKRFTGEFDADLKSMSREQLMAALLKAGFTLEDAPKAQPPDTGGEWEEFEIGKVLMQDGDEGQNPSSKKWMPVTGLHVGGINDLFPIRRRKVPPSASVEELQKEIESLRELSASDTKHCNRVVAELDEYKAAFIPFTDRYGRPEITPLEAVREMMAMFDRAKEEWDISDGRNAQLDRLCERQREACRQLTKEKDELRSTLDKAKAELEQERVLKERLQAAEHINEGYRSMEKTLEATMRERDGLKAELKDKSREETKRIRDAYDVHEAQVHAIEIEKRRVEA